MSYCKPNYESYTGDTNYKNNDIFVTPSIEIYSTNNEKFVPFYIEGVLSTFDESVHPFVDNRLSKATCRL